jgi:hypothetical protein
MNADDGPVPQTKLSSGNGREEVKVTNGRIRASRAKANAKLGSGTKTEGTQLTLMQIYRLEG